MVVGPVLRSMVTRVLGVSVEESTVGYRFVVMMIWVSFSLRTLDDGVKHAVRCGFGHQRRLDGAVAQICEALGACLWFLPFGKASVAAVVAPAGGRHLHPVAVAPRIHVLADQKFVYQFPFFYLALYVFGK